MTITNKQTVFGTREAVETPINDIEYEALRKQVAKEHHSAFYGGIGHIATDEEAVLIQQPIDVGPWVGM